LTRLEDVSRPIDEPLTDTFEQRWDIRQTRGRQRSKRSRTHAGVGLAALALLIAVVALWGTVG
jgi:hypothetical protein